MRKLYYIKALKLNSFQKVVFFLLAILVQSSLMADISLESDGSVLLPLQKQMRSRFNTERQLELIRTSEWQEFTKKNGNWSVMWNEIQTNPHRAFGKPIKIPGYSTITSNNIEAACLKFLELYSGLLKINLSQLKITRKNFVRDKWYVAYSQVHFGIPVLFSEVDLRISDQGEVIAFGSDFFPKIEVSTDHRS